MNVEALQAAELPENFKKIVDTWLESDIPWKISGHVIPRGTDRIAIPLNTTQVKPHPDVELHLRRHGYEIENYITGKARDPKGRIINIAKVLNRTNADSAVSASFHLDSARQNRRCDELWIVISRHPYDVAGMSTNKSWTSCMDMKKKTGEVMLLPHDIYYGTHIAYLCGKSAAGYHVLARIALKPFREEKTERLILYPESKVYGTAPDSFAETVRDWCSRHFPMKPNTFYVKQRKVYDDSQGFETVVADVSTITDEHIREIMKPGASCWPERGRVARRSFIRTHGSERQNILMEEIAGIRTRAYQAA